MFKVKSDQHETTQSTIPPMHMYRCWANDYDLSRIAKAFLHRNLQGPCIVDTEGHLDFKAIDGILARYPFMMSHIVVQNWAPAMVQTYRQQSTIPSEEQLVRSGCAYVITEDVFRYSSELAMTMLSRMADAMGPDSKLLVLCTTSTHRTDKSRLDLLNKAGLELDYVFSNYMDGLKVMEASLKLYLRSNTKAGLILAQELCT